MKPVSTTKKPFEITGKHVLFAVIGFFAVVIGVNAIFLKVAIQSFPGEQDEKSYYQGLNYNETLAEKARQADAGWRLLLIETPGLEGEQVLDVKLVGRDGDPIYNAILAGEISRPSTDDGQQVLAFYPVRDGIYRAKTTGLEAGAWDLSLTARKDGEEETEIGLDATTRIIVE